MEEKKKVFVTLTFPPEIIPNFNGYVEMLTSKGFDVIIEPSYKKVPEDRLIKCLQGVYAHVVGSEPIPERIFKECPDLKVVSRMGAGYDEVDVPAATKHGVAVTTTPGANAEAVAEMTLTMLLALNRRITLLDRVARGEGEWKHYFGTTLYRQTIGIIGLGAIGKILAKLVSGFDMRVLAYDIFHDDAYASEHGIEYCSLDKLLHESDFISVNCNLSPETEHMIGENEFAIMKPDVRIVNCARGKIIDEQAMIRALQEKRIAGAALDAFSQEPVSPDNPLLHMDNVLVSPHTAGMTYGGRGKVVQMAFQNIIDLADGKKPRGLINKDVDFKG